MDKQHGFWWWTFRQFAPDAVYNQLEEMPEWVQWPFEALATLFLLAIFLIIYIPLALYRAFWPARMYRRWKAGKEKQLEQMKQGHK